MREKDLVPPLAPLLSCWSIMIAASETGVSTKTGIRDGSVLMDRRGLQWVKLLPSLKTGNLEEEIWNFDYLAAAKMFKTASDILAPSGMTTCQTRHSGSSIDRVRGLQNSARSGETRSVDSVQLGHKIRQKQLSDGRLPLSPAPTPRQAGNTRTTCRGIVDRVTASPCSSQSG